MKTALAFAVMAAAGLFFRGDASPAVNGCEVDVAGGAFGRAWRVEGVPPLGNGLCLDGNALYCGAGNELYVFDVGDPERPRLLSRVGGVGRLRQIVSRNGIVFGAARETGVWVVDARDAANARVAARFDTVELATGLAIAGNVLFVSQRNNGVEFVDVSDFQRPAHIDIRKTPESQSVVYSNGWLYSGEWGMGGVTVFDAHDMSDVRDMGMVQLRGYGDGVAVRGNLLFASTGHHRKDASKSKDENFGLGHGVEIFDISSPGKPRFLSRVNFPKLFRGSQDWWTVRPSADGQTVFAADAHNGLFAIDVSDVSHPSIAGRLVLPNEEAVSYIAVGSNVVYYTAHGYGLGVVQCALARPCPFSTGTAPLRPEVRKSYDTAADSHFTAWMPPRRVQVRGAAACGKCLYAACGAGGLWALKKDAKGGLRQVKRLGPRVCCDVAVRGGRLFSAEDVDGLAVYSLDNPFAPREIARTKDFAGSGLQCAIWVTAPECRYVVVSNRDGYYALDVETLRPSGGPFRLCPAWGRYVAEDVVGGRYLALHGCNVGFRWVDMGGDVPHTCDISRVNTCGQTDNACAFRGDRLLRMSRGVMQFLRPGESGENQWKGVELEGKCSGYPSWDGGNRVALTSRIDKMAAMVDVTDEARPRVVWREKLSGHPDRSFFWQGTLVIPCGYQGLLLERE